MVEAITKFLGLLSPSFCLASVLANGDIADQMLSQIGDVLECNLEPVDPATLAFDADDEQQPQFQHELLEWCYVMDTGSQEMGGVRKRRREAQNVFSFFGAPWTNKYGLVHTCHTGCCGPPGVGPCANKNESIKRARELAQFIFLPPISEPAANKYAKVDPCLRSVTVIAWLSACSAKL